jgi:hypothetical protein
MTKLHIVVHFIIPVTWEAEAGGSWVQGQPSQHSDTQSKKKKKKKRNDQNFGYVAQW